MTAYDEAIAKAVTEGRPFYVNKHCAGDELVLLADPYKATQCCAVAHPDGRLDFVVQGYSHAVALSHPSN